MGKNLEIDQTLGQLIRELRLEMNISQEKLAELGDFERSYISKVENGERAIRVKTFIRFAHALNKQPSEMMILLEQQIGQ